MTSSERSGSTTRRVRIRRRRVAGLLVAGAAIVAALGDQQPESAAPTATAVATFAPPPVEVAPAEPRGGPGEASGAVPGRTSVFDAELPGVANLDPDLLAAVRRAATDAGVAFFVDSGWRSAEYQQRLLDEAISKYGSAAEAARWVATPNRSAHVSGDAIDIGPAAATAWLSEHGSAYGLCQIYANEPWHYELRPEAGEHGCPPMYADPTHDPRMQQ